MKIGLLQAKAVKGDITANLDNHLKLLAFAKSAGVDLAVFPELSLTSYEPTLVKELATTIDDYRLDVLQLVSDEHRMSIGAGLPVNTKGGIMIAMVVFQPGNGRQVYYKQYIHSDEEPYFINGNREKIKWLDPSPKIGLAICYESSVPAHIEQVVKDGGELYLASVAKTAESMDRSYQSMPLVARQFGIPVLMVNAVGDCDGWSCVGRSTVWNREGDVVGTLDDKREGLLLYDTEKGAVEVKYV